MIRSWLLVLLLIALPCHAQTPFNDVAGDWLYSWEQTRGLSDAARVAFFREHVLALAPDLYGPILEYGREMADEDPDERLLRNLHEFPYIESQFRETYSAVRRNLDENLRTFRLAFPDFNPASVDIYIAHSLGGSNGAVMMVHDRPLFYLGIDMMALYNRTDDQGPFFHHEFFHAYHIQKFRPDERFFCPLWMEGLAVHVARTLHPNATLPELQLSEVMIRQSQPRMLTLLDEISANLENTDPKLRYKYFNVQSKDPQTPLRCGYYLGYLLVRDLARGRSLSELSEMPPEQVLQELPAAIARLRRQPPHETLLPEL